MASASAFRGWSVAGASRCAAPLGAARRAEQGRERGGGAGGHQDLAELPGAGLAGHPIEPLRELPIAFPDQFGVMGCEDAPEIAVQALDV